MRSRIIYFLIVILLSSGSCSKSTGTTVRVAKPKYHHRWFDRKNDKRVKRVKWVKVKN